MDQTHQKLQFMVPNKLKTFIHFNNSEQLIELTSHIEKFSDKL
jgi:hypothetical protein